MDVLANLEPFPHLTSLSLSLGPLPLEPSNPPLGIVLYERCASNFGSLLNMYTQAPLTALSVSGEAATMSCPMPTLRNLTHLALRKTRHLRTIDSVLEHCVRLESLWVDLSSGRSEGLALFRSLQAHPDALPHLTHLKLIIMFDAPGLSMDILAAFIAPKKHLRCLDWQDGHVTTAQLLPLLTVLPSLPALEVLGLHLFPRDNSMVEGMRAGALNAFIPERVTALRFRISYGRHTAPRGRCWEELVNCIDVVGHAWLG